MDKVLAEYEHRCDVMYLFASRDSVSFYPRFGFEAAHEHQFRMKWTPGSQPSSDVRRLTAEDIPFISRFASERRPVSRRFGTDCSSGIFMYYCLNVFPEHLYYLASEQEAIVIYEQEQEQLHLFDVVSRNEVDITAVLRQIAAPGTTEIVFHFMPDEEGLELQSALWQGDETLFVKTYGGIRLPERFKHPATSQA